MIERFAPCPDDKLPFDSEPSIEDQNELAEHFRQKELDGEDPAQFDAAFDAYYGDLGVKR